MSKKSAGILLYRLTNNVLEVLLAHPGGPFWTKKDLGAWSIPKGEFTDEEIPFEAAKREFQEETGVVVSGDSIELTPIKQNSGKIVYGFAMEGDLNPESLISNTFEIEWPPKSGKKQTFPEIDKFEWYTVTIAKQKINEFQSALIDELGKKLNLSEEQLNAKTPSQTTQQSQLNLL